MAPKCIHCKQCVEALNVPKSSLMKSPSDNDWYVDLILACPLCGQQYNAFVSVMELEPLEAPDEVHAG